MRQASDLGIMQPRQMRLLAKLGVVGLVYMQCNMRSRREEAHSSRWEAEAEGCEVRLGHGGDQVRSKIMQGPLPHECMERMGQLHPAVRRWTEVQESRCEAVRHGGLPSEAGIEEVQHAAVPVTSVWEGKRMDVVEPMHSDVWLGNKEADERFGKAHRSERQLWQGRGSRQVLRKSALQPGQLRRDCVGSIQEVRQPLWRRAADSQEDNQDRTAVGWHAVPCFG